MKRLTTAATLFCLICLSLSSAFGAGWTVSTDLGVGSGVEVTGISAVDDDNVWAVVNYDSLNLAGSGEIFYYDGSTWFLETSTYTVQTGEHRGVYAYDNSNVWVTGNSISPQQGRIYYYNGSLWALQTDMVSNSSILYGVWADSASSVWVTGNSGRIHHSSDGGATWEVATDTGSEVWQAIHGLGGSSIWAVGNSNPARIIYYNGADWAVQTDVTLPNTSDYLRGVFASSPTDVWAAGDGGIVLNFDGTSWSVSTDVYASDTWNYGAVSAQSGNRV